MAQSLLIEIKNEKKRIADLYYQWEGYTANAVIRTAKVIKEIKGCGTDREIRRNLFRYVLKEGGGISPEKDFEDFVSSPEGKELDLPAYRVMNSRRHRDNGLLSFSEEGHEKNAMWADLSVEIDAASNTVKSGIFRNVFDSLEEYKASEKKRMEKFRCKGYPYADRPMEAFEKLSSMTFKEAEEMAEKLKKDGMASDLSEDLAYREDIMLETGTGKIYACVYDQRIR